MNKLAGCEIGPLIRGRRPSKHGVAMGMATEAGDYVAMAARLRCRKRIDLPQMLRRLVDQRFAKRNATFEQRDLLRVAEGQYEEGLLPYCRELSVLAPLEAIDREAERLVILRECSGGSRWTVREN
jgi:hypothetical protein